MKNQTQGLHGVIVAGVGGQGVLTVARLILEAAWRSGFYAIQSEVHGMSQRGGAVNAQVLFDQEKVTSPLILEGSAELILGLEPLEALRYVPFLKDQGAMVVSSVPVKTIENYPDEKEICTELENITGTVLINTDEHTKKLKHRHAGNILLLGAASSFLPINVDVWKEIIAERFRSKTEKVIQKNIEAFEYGIKLSK